MQLLLLTTCLLLFTYLTWRNFYAGLFLLFLLLPTYLIRFHLGLLPTTLLEIMIWILTVIWLIKSYKSIPSILSSLIIQYKFLFISIALFLLAATISIFTGVDLRAAAGEWKAFYVEPVLIFLILITTINETSYKQQRQDQKIRRSEDQKLQRSFDLSIFQSSTTDTILFALILSGLVTSLLAIYQHFTGWLVPYSFWANRNTFRVTAWYGYPNAVGLFLAPLIPLSVYLVKNYWEKIKNYKIQDTNKLKISISKSYLKFKVWFLFVSGILFFVSSLLAIFYSKGTGPLLGALAGIVFLLLIYKKTRWFMFVGVLISIIALVSLPQLSNFRQEILLQDRSGQIRLAIWKETTAFLKNQPLQGAGLASYATKIIPYHTTVNGEKIEIFSLPHNLLLSIWVNLGILGLISFILLIISFIKISISNLTTKPLNYLTIYLVATIIVILVMGLVDTPYIKNDLAILFWLLPALLIINSQSQHTHN